MGTQDMGDFVLDKSFDRFLMIAYDLEMSTPNEIERIVGTVGNVLTKMTVADQIRLSGFLANRLVRQMKEVQEMRQQNLDLGKSSYYSP